MGDGNWLEGCCLISYRNSGFGMLPHRCCITVLTLDTDSVTMHIIEDIVKSDASHWNIGSSDNISSSTPQNAHTSFHLSTHYTHGLPGFEAL